MFSKQTQEIDVSPPDEEEDDLFGQTALIIGLVLGAAAAVGAAAAYLTRRWTSRNDEKQSQIKYGSLLSMEAKDRVYETLVIELMENDQHSPDDSEDEN